MRGRWGLQAKMTASYVLVTAAAVVLVEVVAAGIVLPRLVSRADRATRVQLLASDYANAAMKLGARLGRLPTAGEFKLGDAALRLETDQTLAVGAGAAIPDTTTSTQHQAKALRPPVVLLLAPDGRVIASSDPARY
jgi:two-component system, NarL family, sensor histidine kinase LiaS